MMTDPFGRRPVTIEPIAEPNLANGIAKCLDEFVLQNMTQDQLYAAIRAAMQEFWEHTRAYQIAKQQQSLPLDMGDAASFTQFMHDLMSRTGDKESTDDES